MHKCSENLLWVCDLFYGFDRKMSYKDIPEAFQPISIANNKYTFSDGVYSLERDSLVLLRRNYPEGVEQWPAVFTLNLIAEDDTATDPDPPRYLNGVRRVRNICVDFDLSVYTTSYSFVFLQWKLDIVVIRQGQTQAFLTDVLATRSGTCRFSSNTYDDVETLSICYPGYVDLNGGDKIYVRLSMQSLGDSNITFTTAINAACCVRFC